MNKQQDQKGTDEIVVKSFYELAHKSKYDIVIFYHKPRGYV